MGTVTHTGMHLRRYTHRQTDRHTPHRQAERNTRNYPGTELHADPHLHTEKSRDTWTHTVSHTFVQEGIDIHRDAQTYTYAEAHLERQSGKPRDRHTHTIKHGHMLCRQTHTPSHLWLSPTSVPRHHQGHCPHHRSCLIQASKPSLLPKCKALFPVPSILALPLLPGLQGPRPYPRQAVGAVPGAPVPIACLLSAPGPEDPWKLRKLSEI